MFLSRTAQYALRAMIWLSQHPEEPQTTQQIAEATAVPPGYLAKVLLQLTQAGLIESQRGLHGGYTLSRPPDSVTLLTVLKAVGFQPHVEGCSLGWPGKDRRACPLEARLSAALAMIEDVFAQTTMDEVRLDTPPDDANQQKDSDS